MLSGCQDAAFVKSESARTSGHLAFKVDVGSFDAVVLLVVIIKAFPIASVVSCVVRN